LELALSIAKAKKPSETELTAQKIRKTALQRDIFRWSLSQNALMPHIAFARAQDDFSFAGLRRHRSTPSDGESFPGSTSTIPTVGNSLPNGSVTNESAPSAPPHKPVTTNNLSDIDEVTNMKIWLPLDIPSDVRSHVATPVLIQAELSLLTAELHDCLVMIRRYRRALVITRKTYRGDHNTSSVNAIRERQREKISGIGEKIETVKLRYQQAWRSASSLDPSGSWSLTFRWLDTKDIRGPSAADDLSDLAAIKLRKKIRQDVGDFGMGTYEKSWIWCVSLSDNTEPEGALCVAWAKSAANACRWEEELKLVPEEMRRTLAYFEWQKDWWHQRMDMRSEAPSDLSEALNAYVVRQEDLISQRISVFASAWLPALRRHKLDYAWTSKYNAIVPASAWEAPKKGAALGCECSVKTRCLTLIYIIQGPRPNLRRRRVWCSRLHRRLDSHLQNQCLVRVIQVTQVEMYQIQSLMPMMT
jgi:hypothetical protein